MKPKHGISLKLALPLLITSMFALLWVVISWHEYHDRKNDLFTSSLRMVRQDMAALVREMEREISTGEQHEAGQALASRSVNTRYQTLIATDDEGRILFATQPNLAGQLTSNVLPNFDTQKFQQLQKSNRHDISLSEDSLLITAYVALTLARKTHETQPSRTGALYLIYDMRPDHALILTHVWHSIWQAGAGLLVLLALMIVVLHRFVTRPIYQMATSAKMLAEGDINTQCDVPRSIELAYLAKTFNDMSQQLKLRFEQLQNIESTLLEANQQQRQILNNTSAIVYLKDLEGQYLFINDVYKKSFMSTTRM